MCVKKLREAIARIFQTFKCCSTKDCQQSNIEVIEEVELIRDGLNRGIVREARFTDCSFASGQSYQWARSVSIGSNDEASKEHHHMFTIQPAPPISTTDKLETTFPNIVVRDNMILARNFDDIFSVGKAGENENKITVAAVIHAHPIDAQLPTG